MCSLAPKVSIEWVRMTGVTPYKAEAHTVEGQFHALLTPREGAASNETVGLYRIRSSRSSVGSACSSVGTSAMADDEEDEEADVVFFSPQVRNPPRHP